jgi:cobyric acid synthase
MDKDLAMRVMVSGTKTGRGKRVAFMVAAVVAVAVLLGVVVAGFRGRNIPKNAAAIAAPTTSTKIPWRLP